MSEKHRVYAVKHPCGFFYSNEMHATKEEARRSFLYLHTPIVDMDTAPRTDRETWERWEVKGYRVVVFEEVTEDEHLKKPESTEPKEGESLRDYLIRRLEGSGVGYDDALQTWIESYVQREIRKALGGL